VICLGLTVTAFAQTPATAPVADSNDPLLGKLFRSRIEGVQFNPPAGDAMIRELNTGEIVRFVYTDSSWDVRAKPVPLAEPLPLSSPPDAGLVEITALHLTDSNASAKILRQNTAAINGKDVGRIEATYNAGTDHIFAQQALFEDTPHRYISLQMTSRDTAQDDAQARTVFEHMLATVQILDRSKLKSEQDHRIYNTRGLWVLLDRKTITAAIEPLHFMRVVRDGREVGFIQMNERPAKHNGNDGIEVIVRSRLEVESQPENPAAVNEGQATPSPSAGIVIPKGIGPSAGPATQPAAPQNLYSYAIYFVTFDRDHEDWTTITQTDEQVANQLTETAFSDRTVRRRFTAATNPALDPQPILTQIPKLTLDVTYTVGKTKQRPVDIDIPDTPSFYLPQALGQLLPRLLPRQEGIYMFASYVSSQRNVMSRYVDVEPPRDVELEGQTVRAVPITDRIGADGIPTTHYVTREGEWLGSISDDGRLQVFPTDEKTLKGLWPGFVTSPEPAEGDPAGTDDFIPDTGRPAHHDVRTTPGDVP
jgi:hypothetical protein